jgi:hypothetical protein
MVKKFVSPSVDSKNCSAIAKGRRRGYVHDSHAAPLSLYCESFCSCLYFSLLALRMRCSERSMRPIPLSGGYNTSNVVSVLACPYCLLRGL